jgi:antirestriction protein ArdC
MTQIYETITNTIIQQLEQGVRPWHKPWDSANPSVAFKIPVNATTGKEYKGINIPLLWQAADDKAFTTNEYATFKQWAYNKESVKKGEKGNVIIFYDTVERENDRHELEKIPFIKTSVVFNRCQLQSYKPSDTEAPQQPLIERIEHVDKFAQNTGALIYNDGGNRAYYSRLTDEIHLPMVERFIGSPSQTALESYYATMLHELGHWSGNQKRLDRQFGKRFGDSAYAFEELVAELTSAFLCAKLEIADAPRPDHAQYVGSWLKVLKDDKKAILTAASKASQAADYLFNLRNV